MAVPANMSLLLANASVARVSPSSGDPTRSYLSFTFLPEWNSMDENASIAKAGGDVEVSGAGFDPYLPHACRWAMGGYSTRAPAVVLDDETLRCSVPKPSTLNPRP